MLLNHIRSVQMPVNTEVRKKAATRMTAVPMSARDRCCCGCAGAAGAAAAGVLLEDSAH